MREKCVRVLAAALMTGAIGFALAMPALFDATHDVGRSLTAPPSFLQRSVHLVASAPPRPAGAARPVATQPVRRVVHVTVVPASSRRSGLARPSRPGPKPKPKPTPTPTPKPKPTPTPTPTPAPAATADTRGLADNTPAAPVSPPAASQPADTGKGKGKGHDRHNENGKGSEPDQPPVPATPPTPQPAEESQQPDGGNGNGNGHGNGKDKGKGNDEGHDE
jgi:hypothetical protein